MLQLCPERKVKKIPLGNRGDPIPTSKAVDYIQHGVNARDLTSSVFDEPGGQCRDCIVTNCPNRVGKSVIPQPSNHEGQNQTV